MFLGLGMNGCYPHSVAKNDSIVQPMSVFKAYDIRGLSPGEIDAPFAERLGRAIFAQLSPKRVLVGRDMRTTSLELETALIRGLTENGVDVVRIGLCSTPMFNVLLGLADGSFDLGVMVTASHNPGKYNGFKVTLGNCLPIGQGNGMEELEKMFFDEASPLFARRSDMPGTVTDDTTALNRYVAHILKLAKIPTDMPKMKIAIDAGNGMGGAVLPRLLENLPWLEVDHLYLEPDGSFPNHEANPLKHETLTDLIGLVGRASCCMGVAFDGDADRVGFVDEKGEQIPGDLLTALFAEEILETTPDALVLYDVRSSWTVPEVIAEVGGHSDACKVGHANIKKMMRERSAAFAGELSMHFYFHELWNCESGDLAMLLMLKLIHARQKPLSEIWKPLKRYAKSEEINFEVADPKAKIAELKAAYAATATAVSEIDGVRMEFRYPEDDSQNWWFSVRASNTEPLLRLNVEAKTETMLMHRIEELRAKI